MRFIYFTFVFQMDEVMTRKDFEVMAPVGSYESLYAALQGGADSVYFGVEGCGHVRQQISRWRI